MYIYVNRGDIANGHRHGPAQPFTHCPIAFALKRYLPGAKIVVGGGDVVINGRSYSLPKSAADFSMGFMLRKDPIRFRIAGLNRDSN